MDNDQLMPPTVQPTSTAIKAALDSIADPEDEADLATLSGALAALQRAPDAQLCIKALFDVFERFPWCDGFESFWSILHALEGLPGYELELPASVKRAPGEFNLQMVNRCLNAGVRNIGGLSLVRLLEDVARSSTYTERARNVAQGFLDYQRGAG